MKVLSQDAYRSRYYLTDIVLTQYLVLPQGNYTVLTVTFPFKRRMGYYIIQVYIPCVFLVMLSWIVFWMRPDDSASRLTVGITTILTIVFLLGYTNGMLPKVILCFLWFITEQSLFDVMRASCVDLPVNDRITRERKMLEGELEARTISLPVRRFKSR